MIFFFQAGKAKIAPIAGKQEDRREKDMSGPTIMGVILFALGIFVCYQGIDLSVGRPSQPGPGFVPFGLGCVLVVLAAIFLYQSHTAGKKEGLLPSPQTIGERFSLWGASVSMR